MDELYEALMRQLAADPYVFRIPGEAGFMETWVRTLREQTAAAGKEPCSGGRGVGQPLEGGA
ncbi:hypothetical protein [Streptomyces sp. NPDC001975]